MSKRNHARASSSSNSSRNNKRPRVGEIGAPNEDDLPKPPRENVTSTSTSTRRLKASPIPSLSTLACRSFATRFPTLYGTEENVERQRPYLQALPDSVANRLFDVMKEICPGYIPHSVIASYFLRGPTITIDKELTQVNKLTIQSIGRREGEGIRKLVLDGLSSIPDAAFASIFPRLPNLVHLSLKRCSLAAERTATAIADSCPRLVYVNLNYTAVPPAALAKLLSSCGDIETLKIAALPKMTHAFFASLATLTAPNGSHLGHKIQNLKLRQITTPNMPLEALMLSLPNLRTLDVSWTDITRLPAFSAIEDDAESSELAYPQQLTKLSLIAIPSPHTDLIPFLARFPKLQVLHLGAVGGSDFSTLTDSGLDQLTNVLVTLKELHTLSIPRNRKLGGLGAQRELARFIKLVGRRCQVLSLASIPNLKSSALAGLLPDLDPDNDGDGDQHLPEEDEDESLRAPSLLAFLDLSNTGVDDTAVPYLASCKNLVRLKLEATKVSGEAVLEIIDGCPLLEEIALEKCRGVDREDRRRIFEVWEESRGV
ncbi:RNI-like protein [Clavulina sp. PMI_390]|nr:RNI-like protein [Clavulina sp. PMI_390]